ncbi:hypothetical protein BHE74_00006518, partial [Ensete ventricosum]
YVNAGYGYYHYCLTQKAKHRSTVFSVTFLYWIILSCFFFASGGSLFLFDRKVLRYFRKDGHNWRKKKDGKTVKEAHERLKVSESGDGTSFHALELMHIVLVHYREVKVKDENAARKRREGGLVREKGVYCMRSKVQGHSTRIMMELWVRNYIVKP